MSVGKLQMSDMLKEILNEADACRAAHESLHGATAAATKQECPRSNSPGVLGDTHDGVFKRPAPILSLKKHPFRKFIENSASASNDSPTSSIYNFGAMPSYLESSEHVDCAISADNADSNTDDLSEKAAVEAVEHLVGGGKKRKASLSGGSDSEEEFPILPEHKLLETTNKRGKHFGVCGPWSMAAGKDESWRDLL